MLQRVVTQESVDGPEGQWLRAFNLEADPFAPGPGPVLATGPLRKAVRRIRDDLALGAIHICVAGPPGIGKTSLARVLPRLLRDRPGVAGVGRILDPRRPWLEVRRRLTQQLDPVGGVLSPGTLRLGARDGRRWVLLVDAAETLESEQLAHLEGLVDLRDAAGRPLFQCILLGDVDLHDGRGSTPLHLWLDPTKVLHLHLEPLSSHGLRGYLRGRMARVGWRGDAPFTPAALLAMHQATGGLPAAVNDLARSVLRDAARRSRRHVDGTLVETVVGYPAVEIRSGRGAGPTGALAAPSARRARVIPIRTAAGQRTRAGRWLALGAAVAAAATALWAARSLPGGDELATKVAAGGFDPPAVSSPPPPSP